MRKILLLALFVGICNAQAQQAPARPNLPANRPNPARPNVVPNAPTRQQAPITRAPNAPTRATSAPNRQAPPNRPLPNPQKPQQSPVRPNNAPTRAPVRPTAAPPAANVPLPPGSRPSTDSPAAGMPGPTIDPMAPGLPLPGPTGLPQPSTSTTSTARPRPPSNDGGDNDVNKFGNFPTAPTIAPIPDIIFVTTPRTNPDHRIPIENRPQHPSIPITPWNPPNGQGRPDSRCPRDQDSRNPTHLPHDSDCSRFFKCDHGLAFEYNCPTGQHWNAQRNFCDFPSSANCRLNNHSGNNVPNVMPQPQIPQQWEQNWNHPNNNIVPWTNAPINSNPGFENPIIIPMAPRS